MSGNQTQSRSDAEWRLAAIVDSSFDAIISKTLDGIITSWNHAAEEMFGYSAAEAVGQSILLIIPDDRLDEEARIIAAIRSGERIATFETVRRRKDGSLFPISITVSPIKDDTGRIIGASKIARDISRSKENERRMQLLLREVHHRVKNNLQTIASLVQMQSLPDDAKHELRSRITAIAAVHEQLHRDDGSGVIDLSAYLAELLRSVNSSFDTEVALDLQLDPIPADASLATTVGLITNELIYNTNKYGFPDRLRGTFGARLRRAGANSAVLELFNDGVPFDARDRRGTGIRLITRLAAAIDPQFELDGSSGLAFRMSMPIEPANAPALNGRSGKLQE